MEYFLAVLGTFWVLGTLQTFVDAPRQIWVVLAGVVGIGSACLFFAPSSWYLGLPVAGAVQLLQHVENLLLVKGDELVNRVLRPQR